MTRTVIMLAAAGMLAGEQAATPPAPPASVRVAAAADLKFALDDIAARLALRQPPHLLQLSYGTSATMHAQLRQLAPYDYFLSADLLYPRELLSRGIGSDADLFIHAVTHLVVWLP